MTYSNSQKNYVCIMKVLKMNEKKNESLYESVLFLGNRKDVAFLYQAMDVFVLPSRYEGLPVVGVEAQAAGLPCVLSDAMTKETKMTEGTVMLSLDDSAEKWEKAITDTKNIPRSSSVNIDGFDIKKQGKKMMHFYMNLLKDVN